MNPIPNPIRTISTTLLFSLFLLLCGCGSSPRAGDQGQDLNLRIINGTKINQTDSPQIVEVLFHYIDGSLSRCSGSVIGASSVLTAAHCIGFGIVAAEVVGMNGAIPVRSLDAHPAYREEDVAIFYDVAVVQTSAPLNLPALPIGMSHPVQAEEQLTTYGYGLDEDGESGALKAGVTQVEIATPNHLFTHPYEGTGANPCMGDSGGPAVQTIIQEDGSSRAAIVGIVSTGSSDDCGSGDTTLFTNLQSPEIIAFVTSMVPELAIQ